jgi:DNA-directed RNA polymerase specialized sigma subunit
LRDRTEADIATEIGITQQGISKRKRAIVMQLRRLHRSNLTCSES